jgi:hypothetical protein
VDGLGRPSLEACSLHGSSLPIPESRRGTGPSGFGDGFEIVSYRIGFEREVRGGDDDWAFRCHWVLFTSVGYRADDDGNYGFQVCVDFSGKAGRHVTDVSRISEFGNSPTTSSTRHHEKREAGANNNQSRST